MKSILSALIIFFISNAVFAEEFQKKAICNGADRDNRNEIVLNVAEAYVAALRLTDAKYFIAQIKTLRISGGSVIVDVHDYSQTIDSKDTPQIVTVRVDVDVPTCEVNKIKIDSTN